MSDCAFCGGAYCYGSCMAGVLHEDGSGSGSGSSCLRQTSHFEERQPEEVAGGDSFDWFDFRASTAVDSSDLLRYNQPPHVLSHFEPLDVHPESPFGVAPLPPPRPPQQLPEIASLMTSDPPPATYAICSSSSSSSSPTLEPKLERLSPLSSLVEMSSLSSASSSAAALSHPYSLSHPHSHSHHLLQLEPAGAFYTHATMLQTTPVYWNGGTPMEYVSPSQSHMTTAAAAAAAAAASVGFDAHAYYDPAFAQSPSCGLYATSLPQGSAQSTQQQQQQHSSFSPPPQDPLASARPPLKKRIPAVSCHSNSVCANCNTRQTSLWRRNNDGDIECNACNLYFRKNGRKRPQSLKKGLIMKRNRKPRNNDLH